MKKIAIVLAGCGVFDGAEIHESVLTMLYLRKTGHEYFCFAPNRPQYHVIDHTKEQPVEYESRNILIEGARIARGEIKKIEEYNPSDFDALIFPGGFGVAKNFFSFVFDGINCTIQYDIEKVIRDTNKQGKPIGAMCISPVLIVRSFKGSPIKPVVTIGNVPELIEAIEKMGGEHRECKVDEICVDEKNHIVTCPAYTIANNIAEAASGIEKLVNKIIEIC